MGNNQEIVTRRGTHPLFTMMFFSALIAVLVTAGSYVSQKRSAARALQAELGPATATFLSILSDR